MKKLLVILAAIAVVIPYSGVMALGGKGIGAEACSVTSSCFVYTLGDLKNFVTGPTELEQLKAGNLEVGQYGIIVEDLGANSQFVRALSLSPYVKNEKFYNPDEPTVEPMSLLIKAARGKLNEAASDAWEFADRTEDKELKVDFITLQELKNAFGATPESETKYNIDMNKIPAVLISTLEQQIEILDTIEATAGITNTLKNGFYTSTYDKDTNKVWVVKFEYNDKKIEKMTVEQDDITTSNYGILPVVYFDKDYDCKEYVTEDKYACYSCNENYFWMEVGTQDPTCSLIEAADVKNKCVKNAKTGVKEYIVEFVGITAICGVALVLAKKKDIFKSI